MKKLFYTLGLIIPITLISCVTDEVELECDLSHKGMIVDWTGCDGCSYIIEADKAKYEVLNWDAINFVPEDSTEVCFEFELVEAASICMVGYTINLTDCQIIE